MSALGGSAFILTWCLIQPSEIGVSTVGASGAVFGLFGAVFVLQRLGGPVSEVAFIDDRRENVRAAELLGVHGIVWEGAKQAEARLKELGFLF